MREIEDAADMAADSMWELWYEFSDEWKPIPNPDNPSSYFFDSDSEALKSFGAGQIWLVYRPFGQDLAEYSFISPTFSITSFDDLGEDGEGYIVTEKAFGRDIDWPGSKYSQLQVKVVLSCECGGYDDSCENCEGQGPAEVSCLDIEED
jgi:hypothetical protein